MAPRIIMSTSGPPAKPPGAGKPERGRLAPPPPVPTCRHRPTVLDGVGEGVWIDVIRKMDEVCTTICCSTRWRWNRRTPRSRSRTSSSKGVLSSMSDLLVVCDRHGRIEEVNAALQRFTGRQESELKGHAGGGAVRRRRSRSRVRELFSPAAARRR